MKQLIVKTKGLEILIKENDEIIVKPHDNPENKTGIYVEAEEALRAIFNSKRKFKVK